MTRLAPLAAVVFLVAACGGDGGDATTTIAAPAETTTTTGAPEDTTTAPPSGDATVDIVDFAFSPSSLTVTAGTTVTWTNTSNALPHTATSGDDVFDSGSLQPGGTFEFTLDEAGTFNYICTIHPSMEGTIVVEG